jgi:hypothetical protein
VFGVWSVLPIVLVALGVSGGCASRAYNEGNMKTAPAAGGVGANNSSIPVRDPDVSNALQTALQQSDDIMSSTAKSDICPSLKNLRFSGQLPQNPDTPTLAFFSLLSSLAYMEETEASQWSTSLGFIGHSYVFDKSTDTSAHVFEHKDYVAVSFAGTASIWDWGTDLDLVFAPALFGARVHKGFLRSYKGESNRLTGQAHHGVRKLLLEALAKHNYPQKKVYVTGHSLGGALATLLAADLTIIDQFGDKPHDNLACADLSDRSSHVAGVITYGSTRVGDKIFAQCHNKILGTKHWRVVNNNDIFPTMPTKEFYAHVGERVFLNSNNTITYRPEEYEEPGGARNFVQKLIPNKMLPNVFDHVSYTVRLGNMHDSNCPEKHPAASILGR